MNKSKKKRPISWTMIIISITWIAAVLFTVVLSSFTNEQKTYEHVADMVSNSLESSMDTLRRDIDGVVAESMNTSYVPTLRNAYLDYGINGDGANFYTEIKTMLNDDYTGIAHIRSVYLVFPEIENKHNYKYFVYDSSTGSYDEANDFYKYGIDKEAKGYMDTLGTDILFVSHINKMYIVRVLSLHEDSFRPYGVMMVEIDLQLLLKNIYNFLPLTDMTIYINEMAVAVLGKQIYPENGFPKQHKQTQIGKSTLSLEGCPSSTRYELCYFAKADLFPMASEMGSSINAVMLIFFLCIPLFMAVIVFFYYRVTSPIHKLSRLARNIENGIFGVQINADEMGSQEFVYLATQMNNMSSRLENQFERLYREELALRDSRIKALQSQINPHFLGNALETINWEARLAGNEKVSNMLEALSTMMKAAMDRSRRPLVSLSEEMSYVQAYLHIIKERLGKRLEVEIIIDEKLMDWQVPRLILQPIVENAVEHGVGKSTKGSVLIKGRKLDNDYIVLEVINDSELSLADEEKINKILNLELGDEVAQSGGNIGIRNVNQRLKFIYGGESMLTIENDGKGNTVSSIKIKRKDFLPERDIM